MCARAHFNLRALQDGAEKGLDLNMHVHRYISMYTDGFQVLRQTRVEGQLDLHACRCAAFFILCPSLFVLHVDVAFLILYPTKAISPIFQSTVPVSLMLHAGVVPHTRVTFIILGNSAKLVYVSERPPFVIFQARSCERLQLTLPGWFLIGCDQQRKMNLEL